MDGWMDGWIYRGEDGWMDGGLIYTLVYCCRPPVPTPSVFRQTVDHSGTTACERKHRKQIPRPRHGRGRHLGRLQDIGYPPGDVINTKRENDVTNDDSATGPNNSGICVFNDFNTGDIINNKQWPTANYPLHTVGLSNYLNVHEERVEVDRGNVHLAAEV